MDILSLIKNFLSDKNTQAILPLINLLRENSFDLKRTINSLSPETLSPILETFIQNGGNNQNFYADTTANGVTAIANVADSEIVYALNKYLNATT